MTNETQAPPAEEVRERILEAAKHGDLAAIEEAWTQVPAHPPADAEFYNRLIHHMTINGGLDALHVLLVTLLEELASRGDWKLVLRIVQVSSATWPASAELRSFVVRGLEATYASHPNLQEMLDASRLRDDSIPLDQCLKRFLQLRRLGPGQVYQHAYWGEGVVTRLDVANRKVTFDFATEKNKTLNFEGVRDFLKYLPPGHFLAIRTADPDAYVEMVEERPVEAVKLALEGHGGRLKQSELKKLILGTQFDDKWWTKWWAKARTELRMDPMIDFDAKGGAHAELALREKPKTADDEAEDLFFGPGADLNTRAAAVARLAESRRSGGKAPIDLITRMLTTLSNEFRLHGDQWTPALRLEVAMMAEDLRAFDPALAGEGAAIPSSASLLETLDDYSDLAELEQADYAARALKLLMERDGEKAMAKAARLLPRAPVKLAQAIWKDLGEVAHRELAIPAIQTLLERPLDNPDTYFWAVKTAMDGGQEHLTDFFPLSTLIPEVLDQMEYLQGVTETPSASKQQVQGAKGLLSKLKSHLQTDNFAALCAAAEEMTLEQAQRLRRSLAGHPALNEQYRAAAERQLVLTRRELLELDIAKAEAARAASSTAVAGGPAGGDGDLHYTTARAREEKLHELNDLMTVKIPENAREIEKARAEGDLKENAGYIYAKEQQKLLMQQSLQLQQALQTARVFDKSKVSTQSIGFGVRFEAQNEKSGKVEQYTVLGRFEVDPDRNIISYQAPFMQQFIGKKVGERVLVRHTDGSETPYVVKTIEDALASGEWDSQERGEE